MLRAAGILLGIGLAAFLDALVFHHLLQWHHYVSARTSDLRLNLRADGLFEMVAWLALVAGIVTLWRAKASGAGATRDNARVLVGSIVGAGAAFNALDVVANHFLLGLHWLHPSGDPRYDVAFLALNVAVAIGGAWIARAGRRREMPGRDRRDRPWAPGNGGC